MLTLVEKVDSLLNEEAANDVRFPKLAVYAPNRDNFVTLPYYYILNIFKCFKVKCSGTKDRLMIKAAHILVQQIKQIIESQAQDKGEDEDNNEEKKVIQKICDLLKPDNLSFNFRNWPYGELTF